MSKVLTGKTIVITRPVHQAAPLARQIEELGGKTLIFSTLEILPIADNRSLMAAVSHLAEYQIAIFVSANAVSYALPHCPQPFPAIAIAIGPGTARALADYHVQPVLTPESHHSEGLLELPALQNIRGQKIAIFCGENTRSMLSAALTGRGAMVDEIICYRRHCPDLDPRPALQQWQTEHVDLIISTSSENLENLWRLFAKIDREWLLRTPLLVISSAMAAQARQWGFQSVITAHGASDQAICAALKEP